MSLMVTGWSAPLPKSIGYDQKKTTCFLIQSVANTNLVASEECANKTKSQNDGRDKQTSIKFKLGSTQSLRSGRDARCHMDVDVILEPKS